MAKIQRGFRFPSLDEIINRIDRFFGGGTSGSKDLNIFGPNEKLSSKPSAKKDESPVISLAASPTSSSNQETKSEPLSEYERMGKLLDYMGFKQKNFTESNACYGLYNSTNHGWEPLPSICIRNDNTWTITDENPWEDRIDVHNGTGIDRLCSKLYEYLPSRYQYSDKSLSPSEQYVKKLSGIDDVLKDIDKVPGLKTTTEAHHDNEEYSIAEPNIPRGVNLSDPVPTEKIEIWAAEEPIIIGGEEPIIIGDDLELESVHEVIPKGVNPSDPTIIDLTENSDIFKETWLADWNKSPVLSIESPTQGKMQVYYNIVTDELAAATRENGSLEILSSVKVDFNKSVEDNIAALSAAVEKGQQEEVAEEQAQSRGRGM